MTTQLPPPSPEYATKRCPKCGQVKFLSEFYRNASRPDGYQVYCKECETAAMNKHRAKRKSAAIAAVNPDFAGVTDRELQERTKALLNELRARGWQVECKIAYLQTKAL